MAQIAEASNHAEASRKPMGRWRARALFLVYAASGLPALALTCLFSLMLTIKLTLGFWPYNPFTERDGWVPSELKGYAMEVFLVIFLAVPFAMGMPLFIALQWLLRGKRTYRIPLACLATSGLLLYLMFADPGGWTDYLFD